MAARRAEPQAARAGRATGRRRHRDATCRPGRGRLFRQARRDHGDGHRDQARQGSPISRLGRAHPETPGDVSRLYRLVRPAAAAQRDAAGRRCYHFDSAANLDEAGSNPRSARRCQGERGPDQGFLAQRVDTSFPGWVPNDPTTGKPPNMWKTAGARTAHALPLVMLEIRFLNPHLETLNPAVGTFIGNAITVALTTWPLMPLAIWGFSAWLFPENRPRWLVTVMPLVLVLCYAIEIALLWKSRAAQMSVPAAGSIRGPLIQSLSPRSFSAFRRHEVCRREFQHHHRGQRPASTEETRLARGERVARRRHLAVLDAADRHSHADRSRDAAWPALGLTPSGLDIAATCTIAELERFEARQRGPLRRCCGSCCHALLMSFKIYNAATVGGNLVYVTAGRRDDLAHGVARRRLHALAARANPRKVAALDFVAGNHHECTRAGRAVTQHPSSGKRA